MSLWSHLFGVRQYKPYEPALSPPVSWPWPDPPAGFAREEIMHCLDEALAEYGMTAPRHRVWMSFWDRLLDGADAPPRTPAALPLSPKEPSNDQ